MTYTYYDRAKDTALFSSHGKPIVFKQVQQGD